MAGTHEGMEAAGTDDSGEGGGGQL
jgi:hypothetical protein